MLIVHSNSTTSTQFTVIFSVVYQHFCFYELFSIPWYLIADFSFSYTCDEFVINDTASGNVAKIRKQIEKLA